MARLRGRTAEELAAGGYVEEDMLNRNDRAHRQARGPVLGDRAAFDKQFRAGVGRAVAAAECHTADRGYAVKRFAAKAESGDAVQVGGGAKFAGGVALRGQLQLCGRDAMAIVGHLQQALAPLPDLHMHLGCPGVETILDQFFGDIHRALHHLTGGDLPGYILRK